MAAPPIPALNVTSSCGSAPPTSITQYFLPGSRPVAAICRLSIGPNELIATLACAADVTPGGGVNSRCSACCRQAERPQVRRSAIRGDCIRHIHQRLWQLPYGNCGHAPIRGRIDRLHTIAVFQTNVNATSIPGAPDAVREIAGLDGRDQLRRRAGTAPDRPAPRSCHRPLRMRTVPQYSLRR